MILEGRHTQTMAPKSEMLTVEEFASLVTVGDTPINGPGAKIPAEHSARLTALGYIIDVSGRLRMTTPGRRRIDDIHETIVEETAGGRRCRNCGAVAGFVGQMLDSAKGRTVRMFRCHCGEQAWFSDPA
jgi:hypothetical protein